MSTVLIVQFASASVILRFCDTLIGKSSYILYINTKVHKVVRIVLAAKSHNPPPHIRIESTASIVDPAVVKLGIIERRS